MSKWSVRYAGSLLFLKPLSWIENFVSSGDFWDRAAVCLCIDKDRLSTSDTFEIFSCLDFRLLQF